MVKNISEHEWYMNYEHDVLNCSKPVVLVFGAEWCTACKGLLATMEMMDFPVEVLRLDVDECETLGDSMNITNLPTVVIYENSEISNIFENNISTAEITDYISRMVE